MSRRAYCGHVTLFKRAEHCDVERHNSSQCSPQTRHPTIEQLHCVVHTLLLISFRRLVILESMFCSVIQLVNSNRRCNSDLIKNTQNGFLCGYYDLSDFCLMREGSCSSETNANTSDYTTSRDAHSIRIRKKLHKAACVRSAAHRINSLKEINENMITVVRLLSNP
jgi:hypothetical protein